MPDTYENTPPHEAEDPPSLSCIDINIDVADEAWREIVDIEGVTERAIHAALYQLGYQTTPLELGCRLTDDSESHTLNNEYRGKDKPTNVLSFVGVEPEMLAADKMTAEAGGPPLMLGDLVLASGVVMLEAAEQAKSPANHLSHLLTHGVLHLLGHDHIEDSDAETMEDIERDILKTLGIDDPYEDDEARL